MEREGPEKLFLYPENRGLQGTYGGSGLQVFGSMQRHIIRQKDGEVIQESYPSYLRRKSRYWICLAFLSVSS